MTTPALPTRRTVIRVPNLKGNHGKLLRRGFVYNICIAFCMCISFIVFAHILRLGLSSTDDNATSLYHRDNIRDIPDIISRRVDRIDSGDSSFHEKRNLYGRKRHEFVPNTDGIYANLHDYGRERRKFVPKRHQFVPNIDGINNITSFQMQKKKKRKRRGRRFSQDADKLFSNEQQNSIHTDKEKENMILSGQVHLVGLSITRHKLNDKNIGYGVMMGQFCTIDWPLYKKDPSSFPMYRFLTNKSCKPRDMFTYDLKRIVELATEYPDKHVMQPRGFVFHESRCGSTLVANALTAMDTERHRVYSESKPLSVAIIACGRGGTDCPSHRAAELVQDVVFVMGLTDEPKETDLFFKVQSMGTKYMEVLLEAFPETPWIFVYRDPVQTMMSHLKKGVHHANCIHQLRDVPERKIEFLSSIAHNLGNITPIEKCALHLSILCDAAIDALDRSNGMGIAVNYENLSNKLIDTIFPDHFKLEITEERRNSIIDISGRYSKGIVISSMGISKQKEWKEDSESKNERATPEMKKACETFLYPVFTRLDGKQAKQKS